jgi:hypothetical protein
MEEKVETGNQEKFAGFDEAVRPAMKWIAENCHPHTKIIIESNCAELVEGINVVKTDEYLVD